MVKLVYSFSKSLELDFNIVEGMTVEEIFTENKENLGIPSGVTIVGYKENGVLVESDCIVQEGARYAIVIETGNKG